MRSRLLVLPLLAVLGVLAAARLAAAATNFNLSSNTSMTQWLVEGNPSPNPDLTLTRGQTYTFNVPIVAHPFWITTAFGSAEAETNAYPDGVMNNGASPGIVTFVVPMTAPATLFYQCKFHETMQGRLLIVNAAPPSVPSMGTGMLAALAAMLLAALVVARKRASA